MSACFDNVATVTFTGNTVNALCRLLGISFRPGSHERTSKNVFNFEDYSNVSIPYTFELLWKTLHIWDIHRAQRILLFIQTTTTLGINDRVNETLGIDVKLEITSQAADFFNQIFSFSAYGGRSIVKTLIEPLFTCGGWLDLKLRYRPVCVDFLYTLMASVVSSLTTRTSRKEIALSDSISSFQNVVFYIF
jgi:hypothetical protein